MRQKIFLATGLALATAAPIAHASCASTNCFLVTGTQEGIANPGQLLMDLSYRFIPMSRAQRGSESAPEAFTSGIDFAKGEIEPNHHREIRTNNELMQLDASYGITRKFAVTLAMPLMNNRLHEHFTIHEHAGSKEEHFSSQTFSGLGDLRLIGKYALHISIRHLLVGGLGIKAPTGEYKLLNTSGAITEPTIMPGTGSWDGIASVYYSYQIKPHRMDAFASASYQITTKNSLDYQFGNTLLVNGGMNYLFNVAQKDLTASLQLNLRQAPRDEFKGQNVPSTGGTWIYLTPGIKAQASDSTSLYAHVQLPIYQYVNDTNLVPRYGLILGASHAF
ncbi:MAG: transporter [Pseudomonadota bacterium]